MITFNEIGSIRTPFKTKEGMPIQTKGAKGIQGSIVLNEKYLDGLKDLDGFSHITLIYHFNQSKGFDLQTIPFLDNQKRGVFATHAPKRPNNIGISVVKLLKIDGNILSIKNVDMLDKTPLLDIKPYIPDFDTFQVTRTGWTAQKTNNLNRIQSDTRFK